MELAGEILNINNEYATYHDYKAAVDEELKRSAESFVRIGYLLKVARDTDILKESGYSSVNEFAWNEYRLEKSQVSRFIRINDEFSEGGYSAVLQEQYRGMGYAKLAIMLTLPAAVNEELLGNYSKAEIQTVKEEVEAEKTISDLEIMMEAKNEDQEEMSIFAKVLHQLGHDEPELYLKLHDAVENTVYEGSKAPVVKKLMDALAPSGESIHTVRVPGEGRKMLSIKGENTEPVIVDIRSNEKASCTWYNFIIDMETLCEDADAKTSWEKLYGESFPVKEETKKTTVAPVQPNKISKVTKAKVKKDDEKPKKPEKTRTEEQLESETTDAEDHPSDGSSPKETGADEEQSKDTSGNMQSEDAVISDNEPASEEQVDGEAAEQGSAGDDEEREKTIISLLKTADKVSGDIYDYFMETYENVENMKLEDIIPEDLQGIKVKVTELSMVVEQLILLRRGEA